MVRLPMKRGFPPGGRPQGLLEPLQTPANPMPFVQSVKPPLGAWPSVGGNLSGAKRPWTPAKGVRIKR